MFPKEINGSRRRGSQDKIEDANIKPALARSHCLRVNENIYLRSHDHTSPDHTSLDHDQVVDPVASECYEPDAMGAGNMVAAAVVENPSMILQNERNVRIKIRIMIRLSTKVISSFRQFKLEKLRINHHGHHTMLV